MVEATLVLAIASGQSTVPKFTVSSALSPPPPPQAPNTNAPATSKNPNSAALADLPPLFIYHAPFAYPYHRRIKPKQSRKSERSALLKVPCAGNALRPGIRALSSISCQAAPRLPRVLRGITSRLVYYTQEAQNRRSYRITASAQP